MNENSVLMYDEEIIVEQCKWLRNNTKTFKDKHNTQIMKEVLASLITVLDKKFEDGWTEDDFYDQDKSTFDKE